MAIQIINLYLSRKICSKRKLSVGIVLSAKQITQDIEKLQHVFEEICAIEVPEDDVDFLVEELKVTTIKERVCIDIPNPTRNSGPGGISVLGRGYYRRKV